MSKEKNAKPDCVKCGWKPVILENYEAMEIITNYSNVMIDGNGSICALGVDKVLDWNHINDPFGRITLIKKILLYLSVYLSSRFEDTN